MSDYDVQRALATLKRNGWDVDPEGRSVAHLTESHVYASHRIESGGTAVQREVAVPIKMLHPPILAGGWLSEVRALLDEIDPEVPRVPRAG